ncbi:MAG: Fe-S cluster assembly protein SufD [Actinomycetota bacterium]
MTEATKAAQHGLSEHSHGQLAPIQTRSERKKSDKLADFPAISNREEQWKYIGSEQLAGLDQPGLGEFSGDIETQLEAGVKTSWIEPSNPLFGAAGLPEDQTSAAGWEAAKAAYLISIPSESSLEKPNHIKLQSVTSDAEAIHLIIEAQKHSKSMVVLDHKGSAKLSENIEIVVEENAQLTVVSVQDWNSDSVHTSAQHIKLGRNSKLRHVVVSLGGKTVRVTPSAFFSAPGGELELNGVYFADKGQYLEHRIFVDHREPNCKSRVTYKGALQGEKAHTVWVGDVLIRAAAEGTDTYELNRNLLLTDGARADSVPNLEIETGQIQGAGHASASGRFDDEHLFYLQARGISESEARKLVVRGFLMEVIQSIGDADLEERFALAIEAELGKGGN